MKHSYPYFLSAIANGEMYPEIQADAAELLEKHNKAAASRAEKAAEKKSIEDAPIIEAITNYLRENPGVHTASDIANAVGIKTPKATAVLRKVEGVSVGEVVVNKRVVKSYSL